MRACVFTRTSEDVSQVLVSGMFKGIPLKGPKPSMKYVDEILQGFCDAIKERFQTESRSVINATKILSFGSWPMSESPELKG